MNNPFRSENLDMLGGIAIQVMFVPVLLILMVMNTPRVVIDLLKKDS